MARRKLPEVAKNLRSLAGFSRIAADASAKRHTKKLKETIIKGIKKQNLVTPRLSPATVAKKRRDGMPAPNAPLYGIGDLVNSLRSFKIKNGYRLAPSGEHHSGMSAQRLWQIHEYGATVENGFGKGIFIKIPARFPMRRGIERYKRSVEKRDEELRFLKEFKKKLK
jgi:hypothetical protein